MTPPFGGFTGARLPPAALRPLAGALWWGIADVGVTLGAADVVTLWEDQSGLNNDVQTPPTVHAGPPIWTPGVQYGRPGILFGRVLPNGPTMLCSGSVTLYAPGSARTIYTVCRPISATGGYVFASPFQDNEPFAGVGLYTAGGIQYGWASTLVGPAGNAFDDAPIDYTGQTLLVTHYSDGVDAITRINGVVRPASPAGRVVENAGDAFTVGGVSIAGFNGSWNGFDGYLCEQFVYGADIPRGNPAGDALNVAYLTGAWGL